MLLMHKDIPVAELCVAGTVPVGISNIITPEHLPCSMRGSLETADQWFYEWNAGRAIPNARINSEKIFAELGKSLELSARSMGLSLTDTYWFKHDNIAISWADINLHTNSFQADLLLFRKHMLEKQGVSPDYTTDGVLEKFWIDTDNGAFLLKSGDMPGVTGNSGILAANEVAASRVAKLMKIPHAGYKPSSLDGVPGLFCASECMVKDDTVDFVPARLLHTQYLDYRDTEAEVEGVIEKLGAAREFTDMLKLDFLLGNTDRHLANFGMLANSDTAGIIGFAPLFDSGACLGWDGRRPEYQRPVGLSRAELAAKFVNEEFPDEREVRTIVRKTYEECGIPERYQVIAMDVIRNSYEIFAAEIRKTRVYKEEQNLADTDDFTEGYDPGDDE